MTKLASPELETVLAFAEICLKENLGEPHFVALRRDSKRPALKGWQSTPITVPKLEAILKRYDIGLLPASIGMVVVDNDTGGQAYFDYLRQELGDALVAITPSSSDVEGRGHAWFVCRDAHLVGAQRVRFNGLQVGEFRSSNAQIRLTEKALKTLIDCERFTDSFLLTPTTADRLYEVTGSKPKLTKKIELGDDRELPLPSDLDTQMAADFSNTNDRSSTISSWCWRLYSRGFSPAEIHRYLMDVPEVILKVGDEGFNLEADVLRCCGNCEAMRQEAANDDFSHEVSNELAQWVWITSMERFIRITDGTMFTVNQFRSQFLHLVPGSNLLKSVWENRSPIKKFESAVYLPGEGEVVGSAFNLWRKPDLNSSPGDVEPFLRHLENLFPDKDDRSLVLDYLHFVACHPGIKLNFALVIYGMPGIGKSILGKLLCKLLGPHNVCFPSNDEVNSRWTLWQQGKSLAIIEELMMNNRRDFIDRMKTVITEPQLRIEAKGSNLYSIPNKLNLLANTNHHNALSLDENDRRWLVIESPMKPQSKEYYEKTIAFFESETGAAAVLDYLEGHMPKLDPFGRAPMTKAKQEMIASSRPAWFQDLENAWNDHEGPFEWELFTFYEVKEFLVRRRHKVKNQELSKALKDLGAVQHDRIKHHGQKSLRVWSRSRHDYWAASASRRREEYRRRYDDHLDYK